MGTSVYAFPMRFGSFVAVALLSIFGAAGCNSSHIKDVYLSLDGEGHRRTNCIRPTKLDGVSANHYWVFVEMLSFRDDTLLTPILRHRPDLQIITLVPDQSSGQNELVEYGNIAPGEGDNITISWEMLGAPIGDNDHEPLPEGAWVWEFYLDDHSSPDERLEFVISPQCK